MDNSFQEIIDQLSEEVSTNGTSLCIGTFDGVHKGHQKLFKELVKISKINNLLSIVLVFELRPREIINPSLSRPYIIPFEERIQNIKSQKVDKTIKINFDNNIRNISAKKFLEILKNKINLTSLVVSEDISASKALAVMNENKITSLLVTSEKDINKKNKTLKGIIHIHTLLQNGIK